jgi:hypothetical protein
MILGTTLRKLAENTKKIALVVDDAWLQRIADWRRLQPEMPTMSDAIRRLVDQALDAADTSGAKPKKVRK